ncbi:uncharacterized protein LOC133928198 [Phragmites australis]|uniref:uncharacterized protein LOC133928198 n=1 Tax=Phragmites australis TaxID=29695 RepID=UPI002D797660|nr:uncharacterized protein LOC133928198 [Phragmites australis]
MSRGREQQREAAVTGQCRGSAMALPRRGRWFDDEAPTTTRAGRAGWRCRSFAAAVIADCVALGCCPCAVVSLLGLLLVKAPLVVGRRCVGRLRRRRRRRLLLHKKRVRDVAASATTTTTTTDDSKKSAKAEAAPGVGTPDAAGAVAVAASASGAEAELAWLEEMYRVGHWGFGVPERTP